MAITSAERTKILQLIVGMFNAAPGELYLNQIASAYEADGHNLLTLAKQLSTTGAFQSIYPAFMTGSDFATAFLTPLGLEDVPSVFNWIKGRYESGENKGTIIFDAMAALVASTSTDPNVVEAQAILNNKVEVAEYYSVTKGLSDPDLADLQLVLAGVDATDASVDAAIAVIDGVASQGTTFTLLHTQDNVIGTELNDTINGIVDGEFNVDNTFTLGDKIEGNGGFDLFNILTDQLIVNFLGKTVVEVEAFNLDVVNGTDFDLLNLNNVAFETAVANFNGATEFDGMTIDNVNNATALTVENLDLDGQRADVVFTGGAGFAGVVNITNVTNGNFFIETNQGATAAGELTLNLDGADDLYIAPGEDTAGVLTLNVNVNGDSSGTQISNYTGFADDSASVVNLVLNADLQADWWDLSDNGEGTTTTFNISGAGDLTLDELDDGDSELTIAGATATGDLDITVGVTNDGAFMISATTGSGDDRIAVDIDDGYFVEEGAAPDIDMGAGSNTIALNNDSGTFGSVDIDSITFEDGTVLNAQTLELNNDVNLNEGDAQLDVFGLGAALGAVHVTGSVEGNGNTLFFPAIIEDDPETDDDESDGGSPADLALNVDSYINDLVLNTGDVVNMSVSADGELDLDGVVSDVLETLTVADTDDEGGVVWLDLDGTEGNLEALTTLTVTGENYVNIGVTGEPGEPGLPATPGSFESGSFTISGFSKKGGSYTGSALISGTSLDSGSVPVDLSTANNLDDAGTLIAAALNGQGNYSASYNSGTDTISFNYDAATGNVGNLTASFNSNGGDDALVVSATTTTDGVAATEATDDAPGTGFEALTDVNVDAGGSADVTMTDAVGNFTADVTAGGNAFMHLTNTGVTSVTVDSGDYAYVWVDTAADLGAVSVTGMDTVVWLDSTSATSVVAVADATEDDMGNVWVDVWGDNDDLASITATAWTATIDLYDGLDSLATLDLSGVVEASVVTATGADFGTALTVMLSEEDLTYTTDDANAVRETFEFDGENTGTISITGFFQSVGGTGDRIDFTHMGGTGINNIDDLEIVYTGGNTVITSLVDGVDVDITVVGVDLSQDAYYFVF